jgi:hypothetical protein
MVAAKLANHGFPVHPWNEPTRDVQYVVRLYAIVNGATQLLTQTDPMRLGWIQHFPASDYPLSIQQTGVDQHGYITVNGKPFFPVYWSPHFDVPSESNYPPSHFGFTSVDLTPIVESENRMPDDKVKASLLAQVSKLKNNPKFFQ